MSAFTYTELQGSYKTWLSDQSGNIMRAIKSSFHDQIAEDPSRTKFEFRFKPDTNTEVIKQIREDFESKGWDIVLQDTLMLFQAPLHGVSSKLLSLQEFCDRVGFRTDDGRYCYLSALYANTVLNRSTDSRIKSSWTPLFDALPVYADSISDMNNFVKHACSSQNDRKRISFFAFGRRSGTSMMLSLIVAYEAYRHIMTSRTRSSIAAVSHRVQGGLSINLVPMLRKLESIIPGLKFDENSKAVHLHTEGCLEAGPHVTVHILRATDNVSAIGVLSTVVIDNDMPVSPVHFMKHADKFLAMLSDSGCFVYALYYTASEGYEIIGQSNRWKGVFHFLQGIFPNALLVNLPTWILDLNFPKEFLKDESKRLGTDEFNRTYAAR